MVITYGSDLASVVGLILFLSQVLLYGLLRSRIVAAKSIFKVIPVQVNWIMFGMIGILQANSLYIAYSTQAGYYQSLLYFSLIVLLNFNKDYCKIWDELELSNRKLGNLKEHAEVQAKEYIKAVNVSDVSEDKLMASKAKGVEESTIKEQDDLPLVKERVY